MRRLHFTLQTRRSTGRNRKDRDRLSRRTCRTRCDRFTEPRGSLLSRACRAPWQTMPVARLINV